MYAGQAEMVERFGEAEMIQLTNRDQPHTGAIVAERLETAITDAVNLIHGYLAKRYSLPLNPVPPMAVIWTCHLARWFLQPHSAPEQIKANYERTLEELKAAADGEIMLDSEEVGAQFSGTAELVGPGRIFDRLNGF